MQPHLGFGDLHALGLAQRQDGTRLCPSDDAEMPPGSSQAGYRTRFSGPQGR